MNKQEASLEIIEIYRDDYNDLQKAIQKSYDILCIHGRHLDEEAYMRVLKYLEESSQLLTDIDA